MKSIRELYRIGTGPSSSHTMGPRKAAEIFLEKHPEAKAFQEKYTYPFTHASLSFTATSGAEVKYENQKTDPDIQILGVDDFFLTNSGLELADGRNFTGFDIENNKSPIINWLEYKKLPLPHNVKFPKDPTILKEKVEI